jgi:hypothetical protein
MLGIHRIKGAVFEDATALAYFVLNRKNLEKIF